MSERPRLSELPPPPAPIAGEPELDLLEPEPMWAEIHTTGGMAVVALILGIVNFVLTIVLLILVAS